MKLYVYKPRKRNIKDVGKYQYYFRNNKLIKAPSNMPKVKANCMPEKKKLSSFSTKVSKYAIIPISPFFLLIL